MFLSRDTILKIFSTGNFPQTWKQAIMVPILKKDKTAKDPASYRPISLLLVGGKILESLILIRLNPYIQHRKLIPCIQAKFRSGMSTSINLKRMYNKAYTRSVRATHPDPTIMIFFNAKKAFDKCMGHRCPTQSHERWSPCHIHQIPQILANQ